MIDVPKLRGHHLICLHFFSGKGYNREFVENLEDTIERTSKRGAEIFHGADDVCRKCPHLKREKCLHDEYSNNEIMEMDEFALGLVKETRGTIIKWHSIKKRLPGIFASWFDRYCRKCCWINVCKEDSLYKKLIVKKKAGELEKAFGDISPYIQKHTSEVCPSCRNVCCIDRHGRYEEKDVVFIEAIGAGGSERAPKGPDTEPCRFLSEKGCSLPRQRRPFRCTWYFCDRLLESMKSGSPREYRSFVTSFQRLQALRQELLELSGII